MVFIVLCSISQAKAQEDFKLKINDSVYQLGLDRPYEFVINGKKVTVSLIANDTLTYVDEMISFKYTKDFKVTKSTVEEGIEQIMVMTADGNGFLIQKYKTLDPSFLNEMMLKEVTKESVNYGYTIKREKGTRKLKSGKTFATDKALLNYKEEVNSYEILTSGKKDEGLLIMTMRMDGDEKSLGKKLIELMWHTLEIK